MSDLPVPPDLEALSRQVAHLEAEREQLRRSLVQQLNASSRLMRRLLTLDQERFAGRYQSADGVVSPGQDLQVGERIIDAMAQELALAERARRQSEMDLSRHLTDHSAERVAGTVADELTAKEAELTNLRLQALANQEAAAAEVRQVRQEAHDQLVRARDELASLRSRVATVEESLAREKDLRLEDQAEVYSLIADILALVDADPSLRRHDDLVVPVGVLQDFLGRRQTMDLGAVASAAESVLAGWSRLVTARNEASQQMLTQDSQSVSRDVAEAKVQAQAARAEADAERKARLEAEAGEARRAAVAQVREAALIAARETARDTVRQEFTGLLLEARATVRAAKAAHGG